MKLKSTFQIGSIDYRSGAMELYRIIEEDGRLAGVLKMSIEAPELKERVTFNSRFKVTIEEVADEDQADPATARTLA